MLVLASASPRRRDILRDLGIRFEVDVPMVDELASGLPPVFLARENARRKALSVLARRTQSELTAPVKLLVLAVDTIVVRNGIVLSKPANVEDARRMLVALSGRTHRVISGLCLIDHRGRQVRTSCRTDVEFASMTPDEIECYLASGEHADKAGAYGIQGLASLFVRRVQGCYFNVVGLPVRTFYEALGRLGVGLDELRPELRGGER
ncbi:MAG: septum formation protein Maf [Candidatus Riflebacteria bacterium]|nr:septum formation protein Maf [Candidatus Riflebacteria bacterium]